MNSIFYLGDKCNNVCVFFLQIIGVCGLIWYCFWLWLAFEKPSKHPCISGRELRYIEDSLGQAAGQIQIPQPTFWTTPWRKFFTSMPVHAIIVANFCRSWNFYLLVLFQPIFMQDVFKMPLVEVNSSFYNFVDSKNPKFQNSTNSKIFVFQNSRTPNFQNLSDNL